MFRPIIQKTDLVGQGYVPAIGVSPSGGDVTPPYRVLP